MLEVAKGIEFQIRDDRARFDRDVINEVVVGDTYMLMELRRLKPSVIFDIGAHIGTFTAYAKKLWPESRIIAFEPNPESYDLLCKNTERFGDSVTCYRGAVRYDGASVLTDGLNATGGGAIIKAEQAPRINKDPSKGEVYSIVDEEVPLFTIEQVMQEQGITDIDIMKLDCEGSEKDIFKSMDAKTAYAIKHVLGEYHYTPKEFLNFTLGRLTQQKFYIRPGAPNIGAFWGIRMQEWKDFGKDNFSKYKDIQLVN